jgi:hypothetical protein
VTNGIGKDLDLLKARVKRITNIDFKRLYIYIYKDFKIIFTALYVLSGNVTHTLKPNNYIHHIFMYSEIMFVLYF